VQIDFGGGKDVAFFRQGYAGLIRLTRPSALNALNQTMIAAISRALTAWVDDAGVALVVIEGEGRAFCAGGDVVALWHALEQFPQSVNAFFAAEYRLNSLIGRFPKPWISFLDGFVMGGGAGLSMHGSHRIALDNTRFAMPEVAIGFFPDVGMGAKLAGLTGCFGLYLALTGVSINQGDCWQLGLVTHAIQAEDWPILRQQLIEHGEISVLDEANQELAFDTGADERALISHCFSADTVVEILNRLEQSQQHPDDFAARTLAVLRAHAPTSLHVIHRQIRLAHNLTLDECLQLDHRLSSHMVHAPDFREGVRSRLIDKDNRPHWQPSLLADVAPELVERYFCS